ncbi:MAG: proline racemase family protein [Steroidobacteraceae bacterium]
MKAFSCESAWTPRGGRTVKTIDMHTGGEPLRIVTDGLPPIEGRTVLDKRRYFRDHYDFLRTGLLWEPRGHADMYGAIVTSASDADFDVFFLHNEGYSTMCGHAIIALTTLALETRVRDGGVEGDVQDAAVTFNVPAGRIQARGSVKNGTVSDVTFRNVPSFVYAERREIEVPGLGRARFDLAYGGAFYAVVEAEPLGLTLTPPEVHRLIDAARRIKSAVAAGFPIAHPFEDDLSFLYGVIFTGPPAQDGHHSRNVCVFADGEVDRSPTGSGVSARVALHHAKGEVQLNETLQIESILGTVMSVKAVQATKFGPYEAVVPEVGGAAFVTGRSEFYFDPADPLQRGFIIR